MRAESTIDRTAASSPFLVPAKVAENTEKNRLSHIGSSFSSQPISLPLDRHAPTEFATAAVFWSPESLLIPAASTTREREEAMLLIRLFLTVKFSASRWAALATVDSLSLVIQQKMTRGLVLLENGITFPFSPLPKEGESSLLPSHCVGSVFPIIGGQNGRRLDPPPHTHTPLWLGGDPIGK